MLTMRHLKIFLAVAEKRSMSEAAAKLYLSQPTVSQAIGEVERLYGVRLFERYPKGLRLTAAGEMLRSRAEEAVASFDGLDALMRGAAPRPALRVGATLTVGSTVLCPILDGLRAALPDIDLSVFVDNTAAIEARLLRNDLDAALVEGRVRSGELAAEAVMDDRLILVCAPEHPFARRASVPPEELSGQPFLLRERGSGTRALLEADLSARHISVDVKWECHSSTAIKEAVKRNYGLGVLSARLVGPELASGELREVPVAGCAWTRFFLLCVHRDKAVTPALETFARLARSHGA